MGWHGGCRISLDLTHSSEGETIMRSVFLGFTLALGALTAACTIDPPAGTPTPPMAGVLEPGPRPEPA